jgi:hypothetical protein
MIDQLLKFFVTFLVVVEPIGVIHFRRDDGRHRESDGFAWRCRTWQSPDIFLLFALGGGAFLRTPRQPRRIPDLRRYLLCSDRAGMVFACRSPRSSRETARTSRYFRWRSVYRGRVLATSCGLWSASDRKLLGGLLLCVFVALLCCLLTLYAASPIMKLMGVTGATC